MLGITFELTSAPNTTLSASPSPSSIVPPLNAVVPVTTRLLLIVVVPVAAPMLTAVPAPAKLTVVALALTRLIEVCVVSKLPPLRLMSPSTVTSARVEAASIESVAPFSSVTVPPSTVISAPFCRVSPAPPDEVLSNINGPSTVPPSVALTNRSTYCLVAACKASVGSASNVRKPNIVSPSFDRKPSAPVAKLSHSDGTGSLAGELPPITSWFAIKEDEPAFTTSSLKYCVDDDQTPVQRMPELNFCHLPAARSTLKSAPAA